MDDRKLKSGLQRTEKKFEDAAHSAAVAEILLPDDAGFLEAEGMEETFKFTQEQLKVGRGNRLADVLSLCTAALLLYEYLVARIFFVESLFFVGLRG